MVAYHLKNPSGCVGNYRLNDPTGLTATDSSAEANHGTYSAGVIQQADPGILYLNSPAPYFDGNESMQMGAGWVADFNGAEGGVFGWVRVANVGVWADSLEHRAFSITVDGNNVMSFRKINLGGGTGTWQWVYFAGGVLRSYTLGALTTTDWVHFGLTWSQSNNRWRAYLNGVELHSNTIGTWTGALVSNQCVVGSAAMSTGAAGWLGWLSNFKFYNREPVPDEVAYLYLIERGLEIFVDWDANGNYTGAYDNITADVVETQDINFELGYAPFKFLAEESVLTFRVNNASGKYSPENSSGVLYGKLKPNRPVQVRYNGTALWTGRLRDLDLAGQRYSQDREAVIECVSQKEILDTYTIYPDLEENVKAGTLIADIAAILSLPTDLDTGHLEFRYVGDILQTREELDQARRGMSAYEMLHELMKGERGWIWFAGDGTLTFKERYALISDTVVDRIYDNIGVPSYITSVEGRVNRFEITYFPRVASPDATDILWQNESSISIPAGTSRTIHAYYTDEFRKAVGAKDVQTPSGTDLVYSTGSATLTITKRAQRAELTFDNTAGGVDAVIQTLILRGRIIKSSYPATTFAEDSASIADIGLRLESDTIRVLDNENDAFGLASYELARRDVEGRVESLALSPELAYGNPSAESYLKLVPDGLILNMPLWEYTGTTITDYSGRDNDGTAVNVRLAAIADPFSPVADGAPLLNGTSAYFNLYSTRLASDFNGQLGSVAMWARVSSAGVWTDGINRTLFRLSADGSNNAVEVRKIIANNAIQFFYIAGGTTESFTFAISTTDWFHIVITWDKANDRVRFYVNGVLVGSASTLGTYVGTLSSTQALVGAINTTPAFLWGGSFAHFRIYKRELEQKEVSILANRRLGGFSLGIQDLVRVIDGQAYHDSNYHITRLLHNYHVGDKILKASMMLEPAYTPAGGDFWTLDVSSLGSTTRLAY